MTWIYGPLPWYIAGPLLGLIIPALLILGNKSFGISSAFRHICAACIPFNIPFFKYKWKGEAWNLWLVAGIVLGAYISHHWLMPATIKINLSQETIQELKSYGIKSFGGYNPCEIFNWSNVLTLRGFVFIILGGFLVGFGARYAGGCTSGHAIMGISSLQRASVVATIGFFIGGLFLTHIIFPLLF